MNTVSIRRWSGRLAGAMAAIALVAGFTAAPASAARPDPSTSPWATPTRPAPAAGHTQRPRPACPALPADRGVLPGSPRRRAEPGLLRCHHGDVSAVTTLYAPALATATVVTVTVGGNDVNTGQVALAMHRLCQFTGLQCGPVRFPRGEAPRAAGQDQDDGGGRQEQGPECQDRADRLPPALHRQRRAHGGTDPGGTVDEFGGRPAQRHDRVLGAGEQGPGTSASRRGSPATASVLRIRGSWRRRGFASPAINCSPSPADTFHPTAAGYSGGYAAALKAVRVP